MTPENDVYAPPTSDPHELLWTRTPASYACWPIRRKSESSPSRQPDVSLPRSWKITLAFGAIPSPESWPPDVAEESVAQLSPTTVPVVCVPWYDSGMPLHSVSPSYGVAPGIT